MDEEVPNLECDVKIFTFRPLSAYEFHFRLHVRWGFFRLLSPHMPPYGPLKNERSAFFLPISFSVAIEKAGDLDVGLVRRHAKVDFNHQKPWQLLKIISFKLIFCLPWVIEHLNYDQWSGHDTLKD